MMFLHFLIVLLLLVVIVFEVAHYLRVPRYMAEVRELLTIVRVHSEATKSQVDRAGRVAEKADRVASKAAEVVHELSGDMPGLTSGEIRVAKAERDKKES